MSGVRPAGLVLPPIASSVLLTSPIAMSGRTGCAGAWLPGLATSTATVVITA